MARGKRRDKRKEAYWQQKLDQHRQSGFSIRAFCREHKLTETAFYFWRRELARRQAGRCWKRDRRDALFVPVRLAMETQPATLGSRIEIELARGRRIHLTPPVDKQALCDILSVMEARPC
jgi:hypothetical protein